MTPTQSHKKAAIMLKHGVDGWRIEKQGGTRELWRIDTDPDWIRYAEYRAVRIERTPCKRVPLPWLTVHCGMVVRVEPQKCITYLVHFVSDTKAASGPFKFEKSDLIYIEYLSPSGEWLPMWTEEPGEERVVEILSEE